MAIEKPELRIEHVKQLSGSTFMAYAIHANSAMILLGASDPRFLGIGWDHQAIVAVHPNGKPIGIITFSKQDWMQGFSIYLGFVTAQYRRQGIYRKLWQRLVSIAQDQEIKIISGTVYCDNAEMRAAAKNMGRIEKAIVVDFDVPPRLTKSD